jgi:hypothetical protein
MIIKEHISPNVTVIFIYSVFLDAIFFVKTSSTKHFTFSFEASPTCYSNNDLHTAEWYLYKHTTIPPFLPPIGGTTDAQVHKHTAS